MAEETTAQILLVDDDPDCLFILSKLLTRLGYGVQTADRALTAKALCAEHRFDLLVSDIGLPDQTGFQLMREIKQLYGIPGIALSGYSSLEDLEESRAAGFHFHVVKPVQGNKLIEAIRFVLSARTVPIKENPTDTVALE